jgi:hypothetical protein
MACQVRIVEDSINDQNVRLRTFQLRYWRAIHAELMTHRVFSRNASSSRAIPVSKVLRQVWDDPAGPIHWGQNEAGMQANGQLAGWKLSTAKFLWKLAGRTMCGFAWAMMKVGLHKQVANRLLEPWQYISVVLTATDFDGWDELRDHKDAQPEIQELAIMMKKQSAWSQPTLLNPGEWHLPYITLAERKDLSLSDQIKCSVARCARVSYLTHDNQKPKLAKDIELYDRLVGAKPWHASPLEHQATQYLGTGPARSGNFHSSWVQFRKLFEAGEVA